MNNMGDPKNCEIAINIRFIRAISKIGEEFEN
jgi:hypothetical protein